MFYLLLLCLFSTLGSAQAGKIKKKDLLELQAAETELQALAYTMHTDSSLDRRTEACKALIRKLVSTLKTSNSYNYDFSQVEGVAVRNAPDNSFRTITWEFHINRDEYRHYGAIQFNEKKLKLEPLLDRSSEWRTNPENMISGADNWLGYVIYNIIPGGTHNGSPYYFVFGFDRKSGFVRRKVLDVISFDAYGKTRFGLPVFATYSTEGLLLPDRARIILDYSAEANVVLTHDPETGRINYENLIMMPGSDESGPVQMPDGSYHALELQQDGLWHEAEKIFTHKYESAPMEAARPAGTKDNMGPPAKGGGR